MKFYKVFTHDLRSPIQGGEPVWNGDLPFQLPEVEVDDGPDECGEGWNACRELHVALRVACLWPDGRPSRAFVAETDRPVVERGDKCRASTWFLSLECSEEEIGQAVSKLSEPFGEHAERMCKSQLAWREALGRPLRDGRAVEKGLRRALKARGLKWELKRFESFKDVGDARVSWDAKTTWYDRTTRDAWDVGASRDARIAWFTRDVGASRATWDAWATWVNRDVWATWDAWATWVTRGIWGTRDVGATWDDWVTWDAWAAWDARAGLTVEYAALMGWVDRDPMLLTEGLRDAYKNGLAIAIPTGPNQLGWALDCG